MRRATRVMVLCIGFGSPLALSACAVGPPTGPTVMGLPGQGKSLEAFRQDDYICRAYAAQLTGYQAPAQAATNAAVGSAAIGTALGAAAGAAIGAASGNAGAGAAIGAGTGLLVGSAAGANQAAAVGYDAQQRYNVAYTQCMVGHGERVEAMPPGYGYPPPAYPYPYPYYGPSWYPYYPGYFWPGVSIGIGGWYGRGYYWNGRRRYRHYKH